MKIVPKLEQDARYRMEAKLSEMELLEALNTCADSAPGPDEIPYII